MGAAFGGGGNTQTVFGGSGAGDFLRKLTVACAVTFMLTSMALAYLASASGSDVLERYSQAQRAQKEAKRAAELKAAEQSGDSDSPDSPVNSPVDTPVDVSGGGATTDTEESATAAGAEDTDTGAPATEDRVPGSPETPPATDTMESSGSSAPPASDSPTPSEN